MLGHIEYSCFGHCCLIQQARNLVRQNKRKQPQNFLQRSQSARNFNAQVLLKTVVHLNCVVKFQHVGCWAKLIYEAVELLELSKANKQPPGRGGLT